MSTISFWEETVTATAPGDNNSPDADVARQRTPMGLGGIEFKYKSVMEQ